MYSTSVKPTALRKAVRGALGMTIAAPLALAATSGMAQSDQQTVQQLRSQMQQMQQRLNQLEQKNQKVQMQQEDMKEQQVETARTAQKTGRKEPAKGFMVGETNVQISGYIKLDSTYNFNGDDGASLGPSDADLDNGHNPHTGFTAKQSRLNIGSSTPTPYGEVSSLFQFDMYGSSFATDGDYQPRVRIARIQWGGWEFGKDWSTFSDFNYGTMLNFYGPQAQLFERQAQIRYTFDLSDNSSLDLAAENPDGHKIAYVTKPDPKPEVNDAGVGVSEPEFDKTTEDGDGQFPDVVARFKSSMGDLSYQAAAVGQYIEADSPSGDQDHVFGFGLNAGATYSMPTGTTLMFSANYGKGHAKYVYDPAGAADAYFDGSGDLHAVERGGYIATLSQDLAPKWEANVVWGQSFSEDVGLPRKGSYTGDGLHKRSSTAAANLLYSPAEMLTFGLEYDRAMYTTQGGDHGNSNWMQFSAIYNF